MFLFTEEKIYRGYSNENKQSVYIFSHNFIRYIFYLFLKFLNHIFWFAEHLFSIWIEFFPKSWFLLLRGMGILLHDRREHPLNRRLLCVKLYIHKLIYVISHLTGEHIYSTSLLSYSCALDTSLILVIYTEMRITIDFILTL